MGHLWDALCRAYDVPGFPQATGGDEAFRQLVLARTIESASKQDSLRVLEEASVGAPSYPTLNRRLPDWAEESWRRGLSQACATHARLGPASARQLPDVTVVADAGMISETNQKATGGPGPVVHPGQEDPPGAY